MRVRAGREGKGCAGQKAQERRVPHFAGADTPLCRCGGGGQKGAGQEGRAIGGLQPLSACGTLIEPQWGASSPLDSLHPGFLHVMPTAGSQWIHLPSPMHRQTQDQPSSSSTSPHTSVPDNLCLLRATLLAHPHLMHGKATRRPFPPLSLALTLAGLPPTCAPPSVAPKVRACPLTSVMSPKSRITRRPSSERMRLPGCGSACRKPVSRSCGQLRGRGRDSRVSGTQARHRHALQGCPAQQGCTALQGCAAGMHCRHALQGCTALQGGPAGMPSATG